MRPLLFFYVYDLDLHRLTNEILLFYSLNTIVSLIKYITSSSLDVKIRIEFDCT